MPKLFKTPLIMGSIMTIVLGYFILNTMDIHHTFGNSLILWASLVAIVFLLQVFTQLRSKAEKYGNKLGDRLSSRLIPSNNLVKKPEEDAHPPTFVQEACELIFIGEYVATFFACVPLIAVFYLFNRETGNEELKAWEIILIAILTLFWLMYIERVGRVKLCTPYLPIPLKWLVIPISLWMLYTQIES